MKVPQTQRKFQKAAAVQAVSGFTLLEMLLSLVIAAGMLGIVFYFYSQAAQLRTDVIQETDRITTARLIFDRLSMELRTALPGTDLHAGLSGSSNDIQFIRLEMPWPSAPQNSTDSNRVSTAHSVSTLRRIQYRLTLGGADTNQPILIRLENPVRAEAEPVASTNANDTAFESIEDVIPELAGQMPKGLALSSEFNFFNLRYWDGKQWRESWSADSLPIGIEVAMGVEPLPAELMPEEYPFEQFSRVIYLPLSKPAPPGLEDSTDSTGSSGLGEMEEQPL